MGTTYQHYRPERSSHLRNEGVRNMEGIDTHSATQTLHGRRTNDEFVTHTMYEHTGDIFRLQTGIGT